MKPTYIVTEADLIDVFGRAARHAWIERTAAHGYTWSATNPARYQSAVTSLAFALIHGEAEVLSQCVTLQNRTIETHFLNHVGAKILDFTWEQYAAFSGDMHFSEHRLFHHDDVTFKQALLGSTQVLERTRLFLDCLERAALSDKTIHPNAHILNTLRVRAVGAKKSLSSILEHKTRMQAATACQLQPALHP